MAKKQAAHKSRKLVLMAYALLIVAACLCLLVAHPKNISTGSIYSYQNETQRAEQNGYTIGSSAFSCSSTSQCVRVLITQCDNNNPSQFICINSAYLNKFNNMTKNGSVICPQYMLAGVISCACASNYCTENYAK